MSEVLCNAVTLVGALGASWQSFKLLKKRELIKMNLARLEAGLDDGEYDQQEEEEEEEELGAEDKVMELKMGAHAAKKEMKEVLKFWTVFAVLMLYEYYLELFVFWIPFYYTFKFVFVMWIMAPNSKGASVVFEQVIEPQLDVQSGWIENHLIPSIEMGVASLQKLFINAFVSLTVSFGSEETLNRVEQELRDMANSIESERVKRIEQRDTFERDESKYDNEMSEEEAWMEAKLAGASGVSLSSMASSSSFSSGSVISSSNDPLSTDQGDQSQGAGGIFSYILSSTSLMFSTSVETAENNNAAEEKQNLDQQDSSSVDSKPALRRGSSVEMISSAFEGVIGLTYSTRDVLLGNAGTRRKDSGSYVEIQENEYSGQQDNEIIDDDDEAEEEEEERKASPLNSAESKAIDAFSKYASGFENLSDCDDSPQPPSSSKRVASKERPKSPTPISIERKPRKDLPADPVRRRRPVTRSQIKKS